MAVQVRFTHASWLCGYDYRGRDCQDFMATRGDASRALADSAAVRQHAAAAAGPATHMQEARK